MIIKYTPYYGYKAMYGNAVGNEPHTIVMLQTDEWLTAIDLARDYETDELVLLRVERVR